MNVAAEPQQLIHAEPAARERDLTSAATAPAVMRATFASALLFSLVFAARTMAPALQPETVQDDARQHVFWMARFRDPELFPSDLIADYFQSLAPPAYSALYWLLCQMVEPLFASKLLPPLLGVTAAAFTFLFVRRLHPSPAPAFLATVLVSWCVWQQGDLPSATPRAFLLPLLVALLWSLAAGRQLLSVGLVLVGALTYQVAGALGVALLAVRLLRLRGKVPTLTTQREPWLSFLVAALLAGGLLLWSTLTASEFGPVVTADQARAMPEFGRAGRQEFFSQDLYKYWIASDRSGLDTTVTDPRFPRVPILFELAGLAALLPLLWLGRGRPGSAWLSGQAVLLPQLLIASFSLFVLAHLLLFRLYLPNRYLKTSLTLVLAVAAGLALGILCDRLAARLAGRTRALVAAGLALSLGVGLALYPAHYDGNFISSSRYAAIVAYLRDQPKDVLVASVPTDTEALATLAGRRVLTSREHALPYHLGYYLELRRRTFDLIKGYYAETPAEVLDLADRYGVDLFIVDRAAFDRVTILRRYARTEPFTSEMERAVRRRDDFVLLDLAARCAVAEDGDLAVVPVSCLREQSRASASWARSLRSVTSGDNGDPVTRW